MSTVGNLTELCTLQLPPDLFCFNIMNIEKGEKMTIVQLDLGVLHCQAVFTDDSVSLGSVQRLGLKLSDDLAIITVKVGFKEYYWVMPVIGIDAEFDIRSQNMSFFQEKNISKYVKYDEWLKA